MLRESATTQHAWNVLVRCWQNESLICIDLSLLTSIVCSLHGKSGLMVITSAKRHRLCFPLCWFVCLPVSNITEKNAWMDFYEISRMDPAWNKEHSGIFFRWLLHAWLDCFTFPKLGAVEVCALGLLPVTGTAIPVCSHFIRIWAAHFAARLRIYGICKKRHPNE